jgi:hypothetical protein
LLREDGGWDPEAIDILANEHSMQGMASFDYEERIQLKRSWAQPCSCYFILASDWVDW